MKSLATLVATVFIGATSMAAAQDEPRHGGTLQSVLWPEPPG